MTDKPFSAEVVEQLRTVSKLLRQAEWQWPEALQAECKEMPEANELEELLHYATHEIGSNLAFLIQDIEALLARVRIRREHSFFNVHQFNRITQEGWSLQLLQELQREHPEITLSELSSSMKQLFKEWGNLPRVMHSKAAPNPSIERTSPGKPGAASHVKR